MAYTESFPVRFASENPVESNCFCNSEEGSVSVGIIPKQWPFGGIEDPTIYSFAFALSPQLFPKHTSSRIRVKEDYSSIKSHLGCIAERRSRRIRIFIYYLDVTATRTLSLNLL